MGTFESVKITFSIVLSFSVKNLKYFINICTEKNWERQRKYEEEEKYQKCLKEQERHSEMSMVLTNHTPRPKDMGAAV